MAYVKQEWKNKGEPGAIPIDADHLNYMEEGIAEANQGVRTFLQATQPVYTGPYLWFQTNVDGRAGDFTVWFEDGT